MKAKTWDYAAFGLIGLGLVATAIAACLDQEMPAPTPPPPDPPVGPITTNAPSASMPVEVFGFDGSLASIDVVATNGAVAQYVYLQVHNIDTESKVSVRLNGGTWFTATDANVTYPYTRENAFWGMGGPLSTLRFLVPATNWTVFNGTNRFDFRFNDHNGLTIGYRVLGINLWSNSLPLIPESAFTYDDPFNWVGPSTNLVDILDGQDAWYNLAIQERGTNILAHCQDCHAVDGFDLKYYNYSNKSIIARSLFHSVPPARATNIASYIRSLAYPYATNGRPWNPPYQPGPGMDSVPQYQWAAGAGLSNVLDNDLLTVQDMFGSLTPSTNAIGSLTNSLSAREVRIIMELADWNHWLPKIHPLDAYPSFYATNRYVTIYAEMTNYILARNLTTNMLSVATYFNSKKGAWDGQADSGGISEPPVSDPTYYQWHTNRVLIRHWRSAKTWWFMNYYQIQDYGQDLFTSISDNRRWFHGETFRLAPHITGIPRFDAWFAETMQWYQTQLVLNSGNRDNDSIVPIDWGYQDPLNRSSWDNPLDYPTYGISMLNTRKGNEVTVSFPPAYEPMTSSRGWAPFRGQVTTVSGINRDGGNAFFVPQFATIPLATRQAVAANLWTSWLNYANTFTPAEYQSALKLYVLSGTNIVPNATLAYGFRNAILTNVLWGVDPNVNRAMTNFGGTYWPTSYSWGTLIP